MLSLLAEKHSNSESSAVMEQESHQDDIALLADQAANLLGLSLHEKLIFINANKLAGTKPVYVNPTASGINSAAVTRPTTAGSTQSATASSASGQAQWVQPSGPRKPGQGTENEEQGIISAESQPGGGVVLRITLLAAGFVIGPAGASVREIMRVCGSDIKSWTDNAAKSRTGARRPCRVFVVDGDEDAVSRTVDIITAAVDRYKELCEGRCQGQSVTRQQHVMGVEFSYQPPPRNVVPFAAALKGNITRPPPAKTSDLMSRIAPPPSPLMHVPPGLLYPVPGTYMAPGSPGTALFPMLMPQYSDLVGGATGGGSFSGGGAMDPYGGNLDAAALLGGGGEGAWGSAASSNLTGVYNYSGSTGVDPASMMAYMQLMMPQAASSPSTGPLPGVIDTNAMGGGGGGGLHQLGAGSDMRGPSETSSHGGAMGMQYGTTGGRNGSPGNKYASHHMSERPQSFTREGASEPGFRSNAPAGDVEQSNMSVKPPSISSPGGMPYGMPSPGHMMGYAMPGYAAMAPYGCWYPPSPHGVGYGVGWAGGHPGAYGSSYGSPSKPGAGSMPSPSRLNPKAQPYQGRQYERPYEHQQHSMYHSHVNKGPMPPMTANPPSAGAADVTSGGTVPYVSSTGGLSRGAGGAPLAEPPAGSHPPEAHTGSYKGSPVSTVTHAGAGGGPLATSPGGTTLVLPGSDAQSEQSAASALGSLTLDDPVAKPAPLMIGKTPKRPTTSNVRVDRASLGSTTGATASPSVSGGAATADRASPAAASNSPRPTPASSVGNMSAGGSAGSNVGVGGSVGETTTTRPMVSTDDPPLSPSRFTRPGQSQQGRGQKPARVV